jgi:hypothetical protein
LTAGDSADGIVDVADDGQMTPLQRLKLLRVLPHAPAPTRAIFRTRFKRLDS